MTDVALADPDLHMGEEPILREATFNPKVRTYWLLTGAFVLTVSIVGIPLLIFWFPIGYVLTGRYLERVRCVLTEKNLHVARGVLVRQEKTVPWTRSRIWPCPTGRSCGPWACAACRWRRPASPVRAV